jgi:hypothetical protein
MEMKTMLSMLALGIWGQPEWNNNRPRGFSGELRRRLISRNTANDLDFPLPMSKLEMKIIPSSETVHYYSIEGIELLIQELLGGLDRDLRKNLKESVIIVRGVLDKDRMYRMPVLRVTLYIVMDNIPLLNVDLNSMAEKQSGRLGISCKKAVTEVFTHEEDFYRELEKGLGSWIPGEETEDYLGMLGLDSGQIDDLYMVYRYPVGALLILLDGEGERDSEAGQEEEEGDLGKIRTMIFSNAAGITSGGEIV